MTESGDLQELAGLLAAPAMWNGTRAGFRACIITTSLSLLSGSRSLVCAVEEEDCFVAPAADLSNPGTMSVRNTCSVKGVWFYKSQ